MNHYAESARLLAAARRVTPTGAQTMSKQAARFVEGAFPAFLEHGEGCRVVDSDGNPFVDWVMGLGAVTLGYRHPAVDEAIHRQLRDGILFSLPHRLEMDVAERLVECIPCAQQVRFVKTGSEAAAAAGRVARMATGRDLVLYCGYHSWHGDYPVTKAEHPGVPETLGNLAKAFPYNDLERLETLFVAHPSQIAAVMMEPVLFDEPLPGFLEGVQELCRQHGALLIFDEVLTAFRWARAGAQEYFGIVPDLATFGKAMANGMPLACVVGPASLMKHAWAVSGTFGGECLSLAACHAVLEVYEKEDVVSALWKAGTKFQNGFNSLAADLALCRGYPIHPRIEFPRGSDPILLMSLFLQETATRGLLFHPAGLNVSVAHEEDLVSKTLAGTAEALGVVRLAIEEGDVAGHLRGKPMEPALIRAADAGHGGRGG